MFLIAVAKHSFNWGWWTVFVPSYWLSTRTLRFLFKRYSYNFKEINAQHV